MANRYYNNAQANGLWSDPLNWWATSPGVGANTPPVEGDTVYITGDVTETVSSVLLHTAYVTGAYVITMDGATGLRCSDSVIFAGGSTNSGKITSPDTIFDSSYNQYGIITGRVDFQGASANFDSPAKITGDCTFSGTSTHASSAEIIGNCTFSGSSENDSLITGDVSFIGSSINELSGQINGNVTFSGSAIDKGLITGPCVFSGTSTCTATAVFYGNVTVGTGCVLTDPTIEGDVVTTGTANITGGTIVGNVTASGSSNVTASITGDGVFSGSSLCLGGGTGAFVFNGTSSLVAPVNGTATFNDSSVNAGFVTGAANFLDDSTNVGGDVTGVANVYWPSPYPIGGTVTGDTNYYGYNFVEAQCQVGVRATGIIGFVQTVTVPPSACNVGVRAVGKMNVPVTVPAAMIGIGVKLTATLTPTDLGYTVKQALTAIFSVWGSKCSDCGDFTNGAKGAAALDILNGCLQEIFLNAKEFQYLNRETLTLVTSATDGGKTYYALPENAQAVIGPVLMNSTQGVASIVRHLIGCLTRAKYLNFNRYYNTPGKATVYGYHVDRSRSGTGDNARIRIYLTAVPAGETGITLTVDAERETPRYRALDCRSGTVIPMPHQYAESLLVPLLKEAAAMSIHCVRRDNQAPITEAAKAARAKYGMADPQNPNLEPKPERAIKQ